MPKKYQIHTKMVPPRFQPVGKFTTVEFREDCAGSCRECVKKKCVSNVFKEYYNHISSMNEPEFLYTCQSCFRCVQECTKGIFTRVVNPEYKLMGDEYWQPEIIAQTWAQAHTGRIPVSGAGYRGKFCGAGFDSMWTDMSEIVRPTRDGIHGREYISTIVELSRRLLKLNFNIDGSLAENPPGILEIALPLLFQPPSFGILSRKVMLAMAQAASALETLMLIDARDYNADLAPYAANLAPRLTQTDSGDYAALICQSRAVEIAYAPDIEQYLTQLRASKPDMAIIVGLPMDTLAVERAATLAAHDIDAIHFYADDHGQETKTIQPKLMRDMIREIHLKLVSERLRQRINLIFSGGMAMAEHMAKSILCGADAVVMDIPLLIALECRVCGLCKCGKPCPVDIGSIDIDWGRQRITNLVGAWHNQLLEVMGACGIREARRLRGEAGRSLFFEDLERISFSGIFGKQPNG